MKHQSRILAAAIAAFVLSAPVFAQGHGSHAGGDCPHHQATETAMSQALALLDQVKTQSGDQAQATTEKARQHLAEAQKHMDACEEMCKAQTGQGHADHAGQAGHAGHAGHGGHAGHNMTPGHPVREGRTDAAQTVDPVCGMKVDPKSPAAKTVYAGKTYYFCSKEDKEAFDKDPEKYLKKG